VKIDKAEYSQLLILAFAAFTIDNLLEFFFAIKSFVFLQKIQYATSPFSETHPSI